MLRIKKNLKKKGFTLIELMLVVSIILVLMGFLIPKFASYEDKVKITKAINTAKQIETAAMASYGDNNGKFVNTDVQQNITTLTSAESPVINTSNSSDQIIEISYGSDSKTYKVIINAPTNSYTVFSGTSQVYPRIGLISSNNSGENSGED